MDDPVIAQAMMRQRILAHEGSVTAQPGGRSRESEGGHRRENRGVKQEAERQVSASGARVS
jgi:hypothetical protein